MGQRWTTFGVDVRDRDTFDVHPGGDLNAPAHLIGRVERCTGKNPGEYSDYWRAVINKGEPNEKVLKVAKSRGGCLFAILQHYAGI